MVNIGVPQGSVLGPILFLIYVNDISKSIGELGLRLFADDTNVFISGKSIDDIVAQSEAKLKELNLWFQANQLTLNVDKTMFTLFTNKKNKTCKAPKLNNIEIQRVPAVKYLGVYLDESLSWRHHIDYVSKKISRLTGAMYHLSKFLPYDSICDIYYAYVFPYIKYGIEVYGTACKTILSTIQIQQNKLLKILAKRHYADSSTALHHELGLLTCQKVHELYTLLFVFKQRNNILPEIFNEYYKLNSEIICRTTRQSSMIFIPKWRLEIGSKSIKCHGAQLWNDLPNELKIKTSAGTFKKGLKLYLCNCQ
jgi:hypothetical protein